MHLTPWPRVDRALLRSPRHSWRPLATEFAALQRLRAQASAGSRGAVRQPLIHRFTPAFLSDYLR
jgi:hypothetical protein